MKFLKQVLTDKIFPICEIGVEFYAKILGTLRTELALKGYTHQQAHEIVLMILNSKHKK